MKHLLYIWLLLLTPAALGQSSDPESATAFTRRFYTLVLRHPTIGPLSGRDLKLFRPFLSLSLVHKMMTATACEQDWSLHHHEEPGVPIKGPFSEAMTFTGSIEGGPRAYKITSVFPQKNGSLTVHLKLTFRDENSPKPWFSEVALHLVRENGQYAVDDTTYFAENAEEHLTRMMTFDCKGRHFAWTEENSPDPLK